MSGQGKPPFVSRAPKYAGYILLPVSKLLKPVPIRIWAYETADGWQGWLNTQRRPGTKVLPSFWAKSNWKLTSEEGAKKAIAKVTAEAEANAAAKKAADTTEVQPVRKRSKDTAPAGKDAKPGPVKASAKAPEQPPEPPQPTGTDPGKPGEAGEIASQLEQAINVLGPTQTLALVARALKAAGPKPGVRKAKPAAVPARKRAGGKR